MTTEPASTREWQVGPFRVLREVGRGGTAAVYEAVDERTGLVVALKMLSPNEHLRPEQRRALDTRLEREALALERFAHPNVARILDVGEATADHGELVRYIAMEFLRGETLRERLDRDHSIPPAEAADIIDQAASGLDAVHRAGFVHRDVKPGNLMLLDRGLVKVLDFGIARQADDTVVTQVGAVIGSPAYMSPEQASGLPATPASDLWALAVVAYEMLSGRQPFTTTSIPATLYRITHEAPEPLPDFSQAVNAVLQRALSKGPADRYGSAAEFAGAFRAALMGRQAVPPPALGAARAFPAAAAAAVAPRGARRDRGPVPVAALVGVLAVAGLTLGVLARQNPAARTTSAAAPTPTAAAPSGRVRTVASNEERPSPAAKPTVGGTPYSTPNPPGPRRRRNTPRATPGPAVAAPVAVATIREAPAPRAIGTPLPASTPASVTRRRRPVRRAPTPPPVVLAPKEEAPSVLLPVPSTPRPAPLPGIVLGEPEAAPVAPATGPEAPAAETPPNPPTPTPAPEERRSPPDEDTTAAAAPRIAGEWRGTHTGQPALLIIDPPTGPNRRFTGSLSVRTARGTVFLTVTGRVLPDGTVRFSERRVLDSPVANSWDLGANEGSVTGGTLAGTGRDSRGRTYRWEFRR